MSKYIVYFKDGNTADVYADGYDLKQHLKGVAALYLVFTSNGSEVAYFDRDHVRGVVGLPSPASKPAASKPEKKTITAGY
jgi:hypothetical protein